MNIHEAAKSGKPFRNPDMIGAWMIVDGQLVHRDCVDDFLNRTFIKQFCLVDTRQKYDLYWMTVEDLLRSDWETIDLYEASMNSVFVLVRMNKDGDIAEIVSSHPTKQIALSAERYYRTYTLTGFDKPDTDIIEVTFEA